MRDSRSAHDNPIKPLTIGDRSEISNTIEGGLSEVDNKSAVLSTAESLRRMIEIYSETLELGEYVSGATGEWSKKKSSQALEFINELTQLVEEPNGAKNHPFFGARITGDELQGGIKFNRVLSESYEAAKALNDSWEIVSEKLRLNRNLPLAALPAVILALKQLDDLHPEYADLFAKVDPFDRAWGNRKVIDCALLNASQSWQDTAEHSQRWNLEMLKGLDLRELVAILERAKTQWSIVRCLDRPFKKATETLSRICMGAELPKTIDERIVLLHRAQEIKDRQLSVARDSALFSRLFGGEWFNRHITELERWYESGRAVQFVSKFRGLLEASPERERLSELLRDPRQVYPASTQIVELERRLEGYFTAVSELHQVLRFDQEKRAAYFERVSVKQNLEQVSRWHFNKEKLASLVPYNDLVQRGIKDGFKFIVDRIEEEDLVAH